MHKQDVLKHLLLKDGEKKEREKEKGKRKREKEKKGFLTQSPQVLENINRSSLISETKHMAGKRSSFFLKNRDKIFFLLS